MSAATQRNFKLILGSQCPESRITGEAPKSPNNVADTFFKCSKFASERPEVHWGTKIAPGALGTPLRVAGVEICGTVLFTFLCLFAFYFVQLDAISV